MKIGTCLSMLLITSPLMASEPRLNIDGVTVEAVEIRQDETGHRVNLGLSLFPFSPYSTSFGVDGGYTYQFNDMHSWEIVHGSYFFSFDKGLTSELADRYGVNPQTISKLEYMVNSNGVYTPSFGKFVVLKKFIRYFSTSLLYGAGVLKTSLKSSPRITANIGFKVEAQIVDNFSWTFEVRDAIPVNTGSNFVTFHLGTGIKF